MAQIKEPDLFPVSLEDIDVQLADAQTAATESVEVESGGESFSVRRNAANAAFMIQHT